MIVFFYFDQTITVQTNSNGTTYDHKFHKAVVENDRLPFDAVYFSTPSDFQTHLDLIKKQSDQAVQFVHVVDPAAVTEHQNFPLHIGFHSKWESMIECIRKKHPGKKAFSLAILNAMSSAIGDHLIGMQAFDYFQQRLRQELGEVSISLFQLNPFRVAPITRQWSNKYQHVYMMPNRLRKLMDHDLFIDLGTLLMRDTFSDRPMIDFFLEAFSINPKDVSDEAKRIHFTADPDVSAKVARILNTVRSSGRPILLFHRSATSPIRQMPKGRAREIIREIINLTDYFVVSAEGLEYQNKRFIDLGHCSQSLDHFAAIISQVDAIITVDTSTYHLADAFSIPTVALFATIDPEFRTKYYPFVESIMLERKGGPVYGQHKLANDQDQAKKELEYVEQAWSGLKTSDIIEKLEIAKQKRGKV